MILTFWKTHNDVFWLKTNPVVHWGRRALAPSTDSFEFSCSIIVSSKQSVSGTKYSPIPAATPHVLLFSSGAVHIWGTQLWSSGLKKRPPSFLSCSFSLHKWKITKQKQNKTKTQKTVLHFPSLVWLIFLQEGGGSMSLFPQATQAPPLPLWAEALSGLSPGQTRSPPADMAALGLLVCTN